MKIKMNRDLILIDGNGNEHYFLKNKVYDMIDYWAKQFVNHNEAIEHKNQEVKGNVGLS